METGAWQAVVHEATKESDMETKQPCVFIHIHLSFSISFSVSVCESEVAQSCPTLCHPMDCSLSGSSIHGIFRARVLEWIAISSFICIYV